MSRLAEGLDAFAMEMSWGNLSILCTPASSLA